MRPSTNRSRSRARDGSSQRGGRTVSFGQPEQASNSNSRSRSKSRSRLPTFRQRNNRVPGPSPRHISHRGKGSDLKGDCVQGDGGRARSNSGDVEQSSPVPFSSGKSRSRTSKPHIGHGSLDNNHSGPHVGHSPDPGPKVSRGRSASRRRPSVCNSKKSNADFGHGGPENNRSGPHVGHGSDRNPLPPRGRSASRRRATLSGGNSLSQLRGLQRGDSVVELPLKQPNVGPSKKLTRSSSATRSKCRQRQHNNDSKSRDGEDFSNSDSKLVCRSNANTSDGPRHQSPFAETKARSKHEKTPAADDKRIFTGIKKEQRNAASHQNNTADEDVTLDDIVRQMSRVWRGERSRSKSRDPQKNWPSDSTSTTKSISSGSEGSSCAISLKSSPAISVKSIPASSSSGPGGIYKNEIGPTGLVTPGAIATKISRPPPPPRRTAQQLNALVGDDDDTVCTSNRHEPSSPTGRAKPPPPPVAKRVPPPPPRSSCPDITSPKSSKSENIKRLPPPPPLKRSSCPEASSLSSMHDDFLSTCGRLSPPARPSPPPPPPLSSCGNLSPPPRPSPPPPPPRHVMPNNFMQIQQQPTQQQQMQQQQTQYQPIQYQPMQYQPMWQQQMQQQRPMQQQPMQYQQPQQQYQSMRQQTMQYNHMQQPQMQQQSMHQQTASGQQVQQQSMQQQTTSGQQIQQRPMQQQPMWQQPMQQQPMQQHLAQRPEHAMPVFVGRNPVVTTTNQPRPGQVLQTMYNNGVCNTHAGSAVRMQQQQQVMRVQQQQTQQVPRQQYPEISTPQ